MEEKKLYNEEDIKKFHLPRWDEIPNIDLYIDQVVSLLETYLSNYIKQRRAGRGRWKWRNSRRFG